MIDRSGGSPLERLARGTAGLAAKGSDRVLWWFAEYLPFLHPVVAGRERKLAQAECGRMLDICHELRADDPALEGEALYERAITRRLSCDEGEAREIVRLVDVSFAQWPEERDVNFRDVVNYVIVNGIMRAHTTAMGTRTDMQDIVAAAIPEGL